MDISTLEGWLSKKKSGGSLFGSDTRRWFKVQQLYGDPDAGNELALCYFKSNKVKDAKGWIFLSDIQEIIEDKESDSFTIISASRTMALKAETRAEHRLWVQGLAYLCPHAAYNGELTGKYKRENKNLPPYFNSASRQKSDSTLSNASEGSDTRRHDEDNSNKPSRNAMRNTNRSESGTSLYDDEDVKKIVTDTMRNDNYTTEEDSSDRNAFENRSSGIINVLQPRSSGVINTINREGREGREDHRLKSYAQGVDATASRRMREHINSDSEDKDSGHRARSISRERKHDDGSDGDVRDSRSNSFNKGNNSSMGSRLRASHETLNKGKSNDTNDYDDLDCEDLNNPIPLRRRLGSGNNREGDGDSDADTNNKMKQNGRNTDQHVPATNPTSNQAPGKVIAKKGIAPPPGPPPRKAIDVMAKDTSDDENDSDVKGERGRSNSRSNTRSVDEILKEPPMGRTALADQLYDDEEDGMEMDIKAEKRRYANKSPAGDPSSGADGPSRPPRPPTKISPRIDSSAGAKEGSGHTHSAPSADSNFANENWDDEDDEEDAKGSATNSRNKNSMGRSRDDKQYEMNAPIITGSRPDANWLDEDFDS